MIAVHLVDFTGAGTDDPSRYAANILAFTKNTRLDMLPSLVDDIKTWSEERIMTELAYMSRTIPSSWEFVDYTFLFTGVTRAFTHQFVRSRNASFAQQTMRVLDVEGFDVTAGPTIACSAERMRLYATAVEQIRGAYRQLIDDGAAIEDARGLLPTNIHTNIVAKFNLRSLVELCRKRASNRVQGEYRTAINLMKEAVMSVHPWASMFFERSADLASSELMDNIQLLQSDGKITPDQARNLAKLVDEMRNEA